MNNYPEYSGYSYEMASREGLRLVRVASKTQDWFSIVDRLEQLRHIMQEQFLKVW